MARALHQPTLPIYSRVPQSQRHINANSIGLNLSPPVRAIPSQVQSDGKSAASLRLFVLGAILWFGVTWAVAGTVSPAEGGAGQAAAWWTGRNDHRQKEKCTYG